MTQREKILAAVVLALVALLGGNALLGRYRDAVDLRRTQVASAKSRLAEANRALANGRAALQKIEAWQERSLPEDREKALSLYKAWLLAKAKEAGLTVDDITPSPRTTPSSAFKAIGYQMEGTGSLSSIVAMLYEFYRSPQLQQITRLQMDRPPGAAQIHFTLDVEALSLPGAVEMDGLPKGESHRLRLASAAEYQKSLMERDLVSVYRPPSPPREASARRSPAAPPKFDDASQAYFSGSVGTGADQQAWINIRTTGEMLRVKPGDAIKVGALEGRIISVEMRSLVYETGDKKFRVALGQNLRSGTQVDAVATQSEQSEAQPES
jgi:hypothetical protein